jgi:predicted CXXCH cytochrome family protein
MRFGILSSASLVLIVLASLAARLPGMAQTAPVTDDDCLSCHSDAGLKSSAGTSVFVAAARFQASVHGQAGVSCVDCHADLRRVREFPHSPMLKPVDCSVCHGKEAQSFRESVHGLATAEKDGMTVSCKDCHGTHDIRAKDDFASRVFPLNLPQTCLSCHGGKVKTARGGEFAKLYEKSVHYAALEKLGLTQAATCDNCHGSHDTRKVMDPAARVSRSNIIRTCGQCHVGILRDYLEGVHGKDYVKGIQDVPVCTDCHSEHDIRSPQDIESPVYATKVAKVCSRCHDDIALAREYGFLPNRMRTYGQSYHGIASKFGEVRVANCASCHGFHDIRDPSDPKSPVNPANLQKTCGRCHPGATKHFAQGRIHNELAGTGKIDRISHFVKGAYIALISAIIGVFLLFIGADLLHRALRKKRHG